jgi:FkbM family methyltransferase
MLIPDLFEKWNISPTGIVHIGAHDCEERAIYEKAGLDDTKVIWIEGNPLVYERTKKAVPDTVQLYRALVSDKEEDVDFIVTNNSLSSSFLELKEHLVEHPYVYEILRMKLKTTTLPQLYTSANIDPTKYDMLVMDIQGAELHALKGMGELVNSFTHIYLEVNTKELYKNCGLLDDVREYLEKYNFVIKDISMSEHGWGDAYFAKAC